MSEDPAQVHEAKALRHMVKIREAEGKGNSEIQQFFVGSVIFITGGTGFVGKQLLEKLFRSCRGIEKVYLLSRIKRGKNMTERLEKQLEDPVYDEVKKVTPDFHKKIVLVEGDISELKLGIKPDIWKKICDEVHLIYHVAATVRFAEPLKESILTNVRGTREVITLAKECRHLRSLVHVSTAYAHCNRSVAAEEFYPSPVSPSALIELVESLEDSKIEAISPALIAGWPNTYTFSKLLAEDLIRTMGKDLPICIVRPSIVTPAYREPAPGWLDKSNIYGPSGFVYGTGMGILHVVFIKNQAKHDFIPVDFTNNLTIAASWDTVKRRKRGDNTIKIYTISRKRNPCYCEDTDKFMVTGGRSLVSPKTLWYCGCIRTYNKYIYEFWTVLLHYIPGLFIDVILATLGYKISLYNLYKQIYSLSSVLNYFIHKSWTFHDDHTLDLYNSLSDKDQEIFQFDIKCIDLTEFLATWCIGVRKYILKDELKGTNEAIRKQFWFKIATYILIPLYAWAIWKLFAFIFSFVLCFVMLVY